MNYELRLFDTVLMVFSAEVQSARPNVTVQWVNEPQRKLLPWGMDASNAGVERWLGERTIPKHRAYMQQLLSSCGLASNRPMATAVACRALSLNDSYWVVEQGSRATFDTCNLYENPINRLLAGIVFTGYGSCVRSSFASSPEFTTNGALPKCWRRRDGVVSLWKGGTEGAANSGNEPYSEFYAYQVACALGVDAVPYRLARWKGRLASVCPLFTSKDLAFVPIHRFACPGGMDEVERLFEELGSDFLHALSGMFVLDAVICNTDRHFGNFGVLVDSHTNKVVAPAPMFDHGNALFPQAFGPDLQSADAFDAYARTFVPRAYDDFIAAAQLRLTPELRRGLRSLLDFRFKKSPCANLPASRLRLLEDQVHCRAREILG